MKIALITDQHFGARNDSLIFHDYFAKFYEKVFFPYLDDHGITTVVELGDIFDRRKYINYDSLDRCKKYWFDEIRSRNIDLHCIVGNHDIYFKNTNRVNSPDLLLGEYAFTVYEEPEVVNFDGRDILMMPWINHANMDSAMNAVKNSASRVCMGHLELQGFEMYKGAIIDHGLPHKTFMNFDMVMSGHFHHKSSKDNVHYLGSPYEMTWSDYNDDRGFHIFDTDTLELTRIVNPFRMFEKVFYDDTQKTPWAVSAPVVKDLSHLENCYVKVVVKNKTNPYTFDLFMDKLNSYNPTHVQVVEDNFHLDLEDDDTLIDEAEDTITIIRKYISNLDITDPKLVEDLFFELYHDALSVE